MKKLIIISIVLLSSFTFNVNAQDNSYPEKFGKTLNIGVGIGYYGYVGRSLPVGSVNFEFDVVRNFTLAPFVGMYGYQSDYFWGDPRYPNDSYRYYTYRETVVPLGVKGTYYFDELLNAGSRWDFYLAGSIGFVYRHVVWESDYYGDKSVYRTSSALFLDAHIGAEYHLNHKAGLFLDLSTGVSTIGVAIHFNNKY